MSVLREVRRRSVAPAVRAASRALRVGTVLPLELTIRLYGGTDKAAHGYVPGYRDHLRPRRWKPNRILEIGVGGYESPTPGGSLRVWRDWFPRSQVVGFDINAKVVDLGPRVSFVRGDQSEPADLDRALAALGGPPTIVIDDGSHLVDHAIESFRHLYPRLAPGSLYVIEDLHTSYWPKYGGALPSPDRSAVGFLRSLVDEVQACDPTFTWPIVAEEPDHDGPTPTYDSVARLDVRPGVAFVVKGG